MENNNPDVINVEERNEVIDRVTLVDDNSNDEIELENRTVFKDGKIEDYESKEIEYRLVNKALINKARDLDFGSEDDDEEEGGGNSVHEIEEYEEDYDTEDDEDDEIEEDEEDESPNITTAVAKEVPSMEEALTELGESFMEEEDIEFTPEDIKDSLKDSMFKGESDLILPDEDILVLLQIVDKVKHKEDINIYASLPQSVKSIINKYMVDNGVRGYNAKTNEIRNMLASTLIDEFITNISINKSIDTFNSEMEDLFKKTGEEFSKMYKEYDTERTKYLEAALEKIPEGDSKRETITKVLDSINDAYKLDRLKAATGKIRIKNFDREKPERIFSDFEFKYKNTDYKVYPIKMVAKTLHKHLIDNIKETLPENLSEEDKLARADVLASIETLDFLILFCKFCMNYKPSIPEDHAFMYYTLYNIMLLDVYKGEEYEDFSKGFINNIVESYKPYYKKVMTEENFKKRFGE